MPRAIVTLAACSHCAYLADDEDAPPTAATRSFVIGITETPWDDNEPPKTATGKPGKPVMIDVCDAYGKELDQLREIASHDGISIMDVTPQLFSQTSRQPHRPPSSMPVPCPECHAEIGGRSALAGHIYTVHLGHTNARPNAPTTCPECGMKFNTGTQCGSHRGSSHGTSQLTDALNELAARKGQPPKAPNKRSHVKVRGGTFTCPLCDKPLRIGNGLTMHAETQHKINMISQAGKCPDCDHRAANASGMGTHRRMQHGYDPIQATMDALTAKAATMKRNVLVDVE